MNMKEIFAVMNTTQAAVKNKSAFRLVSSVGKALHCK